MNRFVVCYDIASDRRRLQIAQILDAYGDRIQESVFELPVASGLMQECLDSIMDVLDLSEDNLIVYPLCAACNEKTRYFGTSSTEPRIGEESVFVI
ncbi:MAG: CRISPR-associated endonuclease Cas2 [Hyphomonadaceae bacterium]|nr:CRISPR-associated endonuclease Cas2 [Hyphomonadaceae bacterium]MBC6412347.1 CRISPR-associated endonuclease Cas2 [Hyphomonadaceae bacterium]